MGECPPLCIFLTLTGLLAAVGGVVMLVRVSRDRGASARSPYAPLAVIFIGLMVAYRSFTGFESLQQIDIVIMFLFSFVLLSLLGLQFFIVDRHRRDE
jgi:hypothetical protein